VAVLDLCIDEKVGVESGFSLLKELLARDDSIRVIVVTGHGSTENGIRALSLGAASFLEKPVDPSHLAALVKDGVNQCDLRRHHRQLLRVNAKTTSALLIGSSAEIGRVREQLEFAASTAQPALILGETGTGKGLCARIIHELSGRKTARFIPYHPNFGGGDLVQSELFGHLKGSFTGAVEGRKGLIAEAHGGTLFLDEVDEIPPETQVRLLDVLQEKRFRAIGSNDFQSIDCRVVAATNRPVAELLQQGKLRQDLYHRIAHCLIEIPPLRARKNDIPELLRATLEALRNREGVNVFDIEEDATQAAVVYDWPGNVRELQAVLEGAAFRARFKGRTWITRDDLALGNSLPDAGSSGTFNDQVETFKRKLVQGALERAQGNQVQAAKELSLDRGTLRRILNK
jgi:DNA-binding NtrC family response regulator